MAIKKSNLKTKKRMTTKPKRQNKRPHLNTKEELIDYLNDNVKYGFELPFVEEAWELAVKNYEKSLVVNYDENGNIVKGSRFAPKSVSANYFQNMGFKKFIDIGKELLEKLDISIIPYEESFTEDEIADIAYEEEIDTSKNTTPTYKNWLINWINNFNEEESKFLKQRFGDYYNQYDINDGADKTVLMNILSIEIQLYRINTQVSKGRQVNVLDIEKLNKQLISLLEAQKWTKKQRSASDDAVSNKFTVWLEKAMKDGKFIETKKEYEPDQIDKLLNDIVTAMIEVTL